MGKAGLKFNIQKAKIMASGPITFWQIEGEKKETLEMSPTGPQEAQGGGTQAS